MSKQRKRRVLILTESRKLSTGFGTFAAELLPRLFATGKYDIAELASYTTSIDWQDTHWPVYGVMPLPGEKQYEEYYSADPYTQWGMLRFDDVVLRFKPDIVISYRDPWNDKWIIDSPYFGMFRWIWMTTCDSAPQKVEWLHAMKRADILLTYSPYGTRVIEGQTKNRLKVFDWVGAGVDYDVFVPIPNQRAHKRKHGIPEDSIVIGTVMRNQKRKMFAELIRCFAEVKKRAPNAILLLHTSYPEKFGWQINSLLVEFGVANSTYMTYKCKHCKSFSVLVCRDAITRCPACQQQAAVLAGVSNGCTREELSEIYNLMDIYVQYAICGGLEMPIYEASACGIQTVVVNYSAMEDAVTNVHAIPVEPILARELEGNADRSGPNNPAMISTLINLCGKVHTQQWQQKRLDLRYAAMKLYNWNRVSDIFQRAIDTVDISKNISYGAPRRYRDIPSNVPEGLSNKQLIEWIFFHYLQDPDEFFNYRMMQSLCFLNFGVEFGPGFVNKITREDLINKFKAAGERKLVYDQIRTGQRPYQLPQFIVEAERRVV